MSVNLKRHENAEVKAAAALFKAAEAMTELYKAAIEANLPGVRGADDNRVTLPAAMREYAFFLQDRIDARKAK